MKKRTKRIGLVLVGLLLAGALVLGGMTYRFFHVREVRLDDKLHVFLGGGGNTAVLVTDRGSVVIDTKMWISSKRLVEEVARLGPIRAIINTHHHPDHTHGNPLFRAGTEVYAAAPVGELMTRFDGGFWADERAKRMMPNRPVSGELRVDFGEDVLRIVQLPAAHTGGGDAAILFERRGVVHTGDIVFNGFYPNIDLPSGGSVKGSIAACDRILALPFTTVIPGHGEVGTHADVEAMRAYYVALWAYGQKAVAEGKSVGDAARDAPAALRGRKNVLPMLNLEKNIGFAMEEARRLGAADK